MSVNKTQLLSNLGQEFAKQALTTQSAQGTTETNWPLIIGIGALVCCCCTLSSILSGYLVYSANKKEPFDQPFSYYPDVYGNQISSDTNNGSNELRNLIIFALLALLVLYLLSR